MKQKDIVALLIAGFVGGALSLIISSFLFGSSGNRKEDVITVEPITSEFGSLDSRYFNKDSINPTQLIRIGNEAENNNDLFKPE